MKLRRFRVLICILSAFLILVNCAAPAAAAYDALPQILYLVSGETDADGAVYPDYLVDAHGNRVEEHVETRVRAADSLPTSYDLRNYGCVTPVGHQAGAGSCWGFASIASLESSYIRQGFGTAANTNFSEAHLVWFAQRQRTTDPSDPTYGDGKMCAQPFTSGGNWNGAASQLLRGSGLQMESNAPWISTYDSDEMMQMEQPESDRYACYARMWSAISIRDNSATALKQKILQNGAAMFSYYDDYSTTRTGYNSDRTAYYQTAKVGVTNHAVSVIGWDDNYPRTNFNASQRPTSNGAWLVKGSWSTAWGNQGFYWISYEDPSIGTLVSYVAAKKDIYDKIYQYDGGYPRIYFTIPTKAKMANVYTAESDEMLTHAAFYSPNATPVKATVEVYTATESYTGTGSNPLTGMAKVTDATTTISSVEYGYTTVQLKNPVRLYMWQPFVVVVTFEGDSVMIPVEGETVANPTDGQSTFSGSVGESYFGYSSFWFDTNNYADGRDYNNVPVKAMTHEIVPVEPTLSLQSMPSRTVYQYGDTLDFTGLSLLYTDEYGTASVVTSGYTCDAQTAQTLGTQTVTVQYAGLSTTFDVTVQPWECSLTIATQPNKLTYYYGEPIDLTGLSLLYSDEYGVETTVTDENQYLCDTQTVRTIGTQTVSIMYRDLYVTFDVVGMPCERTLTIGTMPDKLSYLYGEPLDLTGLSLLYSDEYGVETTMAGGFDCDVTTLQTLGVQPVTLSYDGLSVTFEVSVQPWERALTIATPPDNTSFYYGEPIDLTGLSLVYRDEYGVETTISGEFDCDTQIIYTIGAQTATISYGGLSVTLELTGLPWERTLTIENLPTKLTYYYGEPLDLTGLTLRYKDEYGTETSLSEGFVYETQTVSTLGVQSVAVWYDDLSVSFDVTGLPWERTLSVGSMPDKTEYYTGEGFAATGLTLLYTDEYGDALVVTEGFSFSSEPFTQTGLQTVEVFYGDMSVTIEVNVLRKGLFLAGDAAAHPGETVRIPVQIADNPGIITAMLHLTYDATVLELQGVENGEIFDDANFTPGGSFNDMPYTVHWMDAYTHVPYTQNGLLVTYVFRVRTDAPIGETVIHISYEPDSTFDVDMSNMAFDVQDGSVTVGRIPGDVNADGVITLKDVVQLRRFLANWDVTISAANADVDADNTLTLQDCVRIMRYLAGGYEDLDLL